MAMFLVGGRRTSTACLGHRAGTPADKIARRQLTIAKT